MFIYITPINNEWVLGKVPGQTEGAANEGRNLSGELRILTKGHPEGREDWEQKQLKLLHTKAT